MIKFKTSSNLSALQQLSVDSAKPYFRMTEILIVFSPRWVADRLKRRIMPLL